MAKKDKQEATDIVGPQENAADLIQAYGEDMGAGFEDFGREDMQVPFINLLQKMSDLDAIPGAKAGKLMNSVTQELYDELLFIPVHREHKFVEWVPRDKGGGFVAVFGPEDPMVVQARKGGEFGRLETPAGNDLVETFYVYGLAVDGDSVYPATLAFTSTQIKKYRRWMTQLRTITIRDPQTGRRVNPPMFAHAFRLSTVEESNAKGKWHGWRISFSEAGDPENNVTAAQASRLTPDDDLYLNAKELRQLILEGAARAVYESSDGGAVPEEGGDDDDVF